MNDYNYIRAETLELFSIEFFAIIVATVFFLFSTNRTLIELYIILLPFTDKVYRFLSLQPSDILSILIVCLNLKYIGSSLKYLYWLVPCLFIGSLVGLFQFNDFFGIQYSFRILLIFGVVNVISAYLSEKKETQDIYISLYKKVVWFSLVVACLQVILWYLNFPIAGIFYSYGIPRMKGLAHEPSTFCFWLALSLPFGIQRSITESKKFLIDYPYIIALLFVMLVTGSTSGILTAFIFFLLFIFFELRQNLSRAVNYIVIGALLLSIVLGFGGTTVTTYFGEYVTSKLESYVSEMVSGESIKEVSGRGGDRKLFQYLSENPLFGIGAFRASKLQDSEEITVFEDYIPAANFYITTPAEFGIVGTLSITWIFVLWMKILYGIRNPNNIVFGFGLIAWMVSLLGMRVFGFHQPWFLMCIYVSIPSFFSMKK
jgi:O-Antigen ligase